MTGRQGFVAFAIATPIIIYALSFLSPTIMWAFLIVGPLIVIGLYDMLQKRHTIKRLYPIFGRLRYILESFRTEIQQYFVESDLDGTPIPREFRS